MANSDSVQTGLKVIVQDNIGDQAVSVLFKRQVRLYLQIRKDGDKEGIKGLGRPRVDGKGGVFVAGQLLDSVMKESVLNAVEFKPPIVYSLAQDYTKIITGIHDTDPEVEDWGDASIENHIIRPTFRWVKMATPMSVSEDLVTQTRSAVAGRERNLVRASINNLFTAESTRRLGQHCDNWNNQLVSSTGAPTNVDATYWDKLYGDAVTFDATSNYAGIDRSVAGNEWFQGNLITTATAFNLQDMMDVARRKIPGMQDADGRDHGLNDYGLNVDVFVMGNALFSKAIAEANARKGSVVHMNGFPDYPVFGYKKQIVVLDDGTVCVNEPQYPAGHVAGISLDTMFDATHPEYNFKVSDWEKPRKGRGEARKITAQLETWKMSGCIWPKGNVYWNAVT